MYSSRERMYPHWYHSWGWTRFSHVLTKMSGYIIVLTWKSFSSRHDSFNLVEISRVICNRCDLVKGRSGGSWKLQVSHCKVRSSKFEVRSSKFEVRSPKFEVELRSPVSPSSPFLLLRCLTSPRVLELEGGGRRRRGVKEGCGVKLTFCYWNLLTS